MLSVKNNAKYLYSFQYYQGMKSIEIKGNNFMNTNMESILYGSLIARHEKILGD